MTEKPSVAAEKVAEELTGDAVPETPETPEVQDTPEKPDTQEKAETPEPEVKPDEVEVVEKLTKDDGTPFTKADLKGLNEALKAARKEARDHKRDLDQLREAAGGKTLAEVQRDAVEAAEEKFKPLMVRAAARAQFAEAGLSLPEDRADTAFARAVKLLDLDALKISDDGMVDGLAEQVEAIRADFPDLFTGSRGRAPRVQAAERQGNPKPPASAAEKIAASLLRR